MSPPIDAAEFDAHKEVASIVRQFLCRNRDKGYSPAEIASAIGITESDVTNAMLKQGLSDIVSKISGRKNEFRIEDVIINGVTYYRCTESK